MREIATIELLRGDTEEMRKIVKVMLSYLKGSRYCKSCSLTETLEEDRRVIMQSDWADNAHRALAWGYFNAVFVGVDVEIHIALEEQAA